MNVLAKSFFERKCEVRFSEDLFLMSYQHEMQILYRKRFDNRENKKDDRYMFFICNRNSNLTQNDQILEHIWPVYKLLLLVPFNWPPLVMWSGKPFWNFRKPEIRKGFLFPLNSYFFSCVIDCKIIYYIVLRKCLKNQYEKTILFS